jgi:flagellar hook-basal body complex protein FliE
MEWNFSAAAAVMPVGDRLTLDDPAPSAAGGATATSGVDFAKLIDGELTRVNTDLQTAETSMRDFANGKPVELHELMINLERARLSVQVIVQVRNKLVESYQDLMRMQM